MAPDLTHVLAGTGKRIHNEDDEHAQKTVQNQFFSHVTRFFIMLTFKQRDHSVQFFQQDVLAYSSSRQIVGCLKHGLNVRLIGFG